MKTLFLLILTVTTLTAFSQYGQIDKPLSAIDIKEINPDSLRYFVVFYLAKDKDSDMQMPWFKSVITNGKMLSLYDFMATLYRDYPFRELILPTNFHQFRNKREHDEFFAKPIYKKP